MPDDVADRLKHDAVGGHLDRRTERRQVVGDLDRCAQVGPSGDPAHGLDASGGKPQLIQRRRAQTFDDTSYVDDGSPNLLAEDLQLAGGSIGAGRKQCPRCLGLQGEPGQRGADTVVQVTAQP